MSDSLASSSSEFCNRNLEQLEMPFFEANGITFHYADDNVDRLAFVFQHGLGADISQPMSFFGRGPSVSPDFHGLPWTRQNRPARKPPLSEV